MQASELSKEDLLMDKGVFSFQELYKGKPFEEMVFFLCSDIIVVVEDMYLCYEQHEDKK